MSGVFVASIYDNHVRTDFTDEYKNKPNTQYNRHNTKSRLFFGFIINELYRHLTKGIGIKKP